MSTRAVANVVELDVVALAERSPTAARTFVPIGLSSWHCRKPKAPLRGVFIHPEQSCEVLNESGTPVLQLSKRHDPVELEI